MNENQMNLETAVLKERQDMKRETNKYRLLSLLSLVVFFTVWELAVRLGWVETTHIAAPSKVVELFIRKFWDTSPDGSTLIQHTISSLQLSLTGFLLALVIGTPLGLLMGWFKPFDDFVKPIFNLIRPIPALGWIPIMILLLGIGLAAKSSIIFMAAFVPMVINSYTGIKLTNQALVNVAKTCGSNTWTIFLKVGIPSAMPMVFAGWKVALSISWMTLIAAEMMASNKGLGYMILMGRQFMMVDLILCGMFVIAIIGYLLYMILDVAESHVLRWRR